MNKEQAHVLSYISKRQSQNLTTYLTEIFNEVNNPEIISKMRTDCLIAIDRDNDMIEITPQGEKSLDDYKVSSQKLKAEAAAGRGIYSFLK